MNARLQRPRAARHHKRQHGIILVTGMLFLVILTLLGLALFRSTGLMDRIAANTRDKQRSFEAAQAALQYGEWWLATGHGGLGSACGATLDVVANLHVCDSVQTTPETLPWTSGFAYQPSGVNVNVNGGVTTAGGDVNYQAIPGLRIENMGLSISGLSQVYQVTAYGYGGKADTGTVVRSTYQTTPGGTCLDCL